MHQLAPNEFEYSHALSDAIEEHVAKMGAAGQTCYQGLDLTSALELELFYRFVDREDCRVAPNLGAFLASTLGNSRNRLASRLTRYTQMLKVSVRQLRRLFGPKNKLIADEPVFFWPMINLSASYCRS